VILVATGGAIGALFRYSSTSIIKYIFPGYPLGTLLVNIIGSFLIGFLMSYTETKNFSESFYKYFLIIGILGSFTTFSAFSYEVFELINNKKIFISLCYILTSVTICLFFTYFGYNINKI
jgi:fluoride exporter